MKAGLTLGVGIAAALEPGSCPADPNAGRQGMGSPSGRDGYLSISR